MEKYTIERYNSSWKSYKIIKKVSWNRSKWFLQHFSECLVNGYQQLLRYTCVHTCRLTCDISPVYTCDAIHGHHYWNHQFIVWSLIIVWRYLTNSLTSVDRFPISFRSTMKGNVYRHVVLGLHYNGRYGALGLSRRDDLMYKPFIYTVSITQGNIKAGVCVLLSQSSNHLVNIVTSR